MHEDLYEKAKKAIMELFEDTSVSQREAKSLLEALIEEIEMLMETLDDDA